jgi:putative endonuclease
VYSIHFEDPYRSPSGRKSVQHYLGSTDRELYERIEEHARGKRAASRLMQVIAEAEIGWQVVRTWLGGRALERQLKRRHNHKKLCPVCRGERPYYSYSEVA